MEVRIKGQMTIADIRQALFDQLHEIETKYAVQYSRGATLYINPTNAFGEDVTPRMPGGHELESWRDFLSSATGLSSSRPVPAPSLQRLTGSAPYDEPSAMSLC